VTLDVQAMMNLARKLRVGVHVARHPPIMRRLIDGTQNCSWIRSAQPTRDVALAARLTAFAAALWSVAAETQVTNRSPPYGEMSSTV
jgi:hypothetical protein